MKFRGFHYKWNKDELKFMRVYYYCEYYKTKGIKCKAGIIKKSKHNNYYLKGSDVPTPHNN